MGQEEDVAGRSEYVLVARLLCHHIEVNIVIVVPDEGEVGKETHPEEVQQNHLRGDERGSLAAASILKDVDRGKDGDQGAQ